MKLLVQFCLFCLLYLTTHGRTAFKTNKVMEVKIELAEPSWKNITADPLRYLHLNVPANVTFNGDYRPNISIRLEGREANQFCVDNNSTRFSYAIDTGTREPGGPDTTIQGSRVIFVHNSYNDPSYMRQMLASYILDDASRAPRIAYINLTLIISGTVLPQGLYIVEENVDAHFVKHLYEFSIGDLFKVDYPAGTLAFFGDAITDYPNLTTIDTRVRDQGLSYVRMVDKIRDKPLNEVELEEITNMNSVMFHLAACSMLGIYNGASGIADNFYVYFESFSIKDYGKAQIISSRFTESFGIPSCQQSLSTSDIISNNITELQCPGVKREEILLLSILLDHEVYRNLYYSKLQLIIDWTFTEEFIQACIDYNRFTIEEYVKQSAGVANFYSYQDFLCSIGDSTCSNHQSIQEYVKQRVASVQKQLHALGWKPEDKNSARFLYPFFGCIVFTILLL